MAEDKRSVRPEGAPVVSPFWPTVMGHAAFHYVKHVSQLSGVPSIANKRNAR